MRAQQFEANYLIISTLTTRLNQVSPKVDYSLSCGYTDEGETWVLHMRSRREYASTIVYGLRSTYSRTDSALELIEEIADLLVIAE